MRFGYFYINLEVEHKIKDNINTFKPIKKFTKAESKNIFKLVGDSI